MTPEADFESIAIVKVVDDEFAADRDSGDVADVMESDE